MLILTRRLGESIVIRDGIVVTVSDISNNQIFIISKSFNPSCGC
jgi:sRNA-binding carbon storage regulator CsrA